MEITNLDNKDKICGIYKILCTGNNDFYIGSSKDIIVRINRHLSLLRTNRYNNPYRCAGKNVYMQNAYNKYGAGSFKFFVIETTNIDALLQREQFYFDKLKPRFNTSTKSNRPPTHNELSNDQKKQKYTQFTNTKTKNNTLSPTRETIEKIQNKRRGIFKQSKESMQKMIQTKIKNGTLNVPRLALRGKKNPEHSMRMKKIYAHKIMTMTEEEKNKNSFFSNRNVAKYHKPKLKLKNSTTGETNELYSIDWSKQYGMTMPALSRLRHNKQDFVIDKNKQKWNKN